MCENDILENKIELNQKRICKTKEYVLRAHRNYYNKHKDDPEYREKLRQKKNKYREEHKEEYNEKQRIYMKEYRARKKVEKLQTKPLEITIDEVCSNISELKCEC